MILFFFQAVTIATDYGDMKIELFCEDTPKTCEVCRIKFQKSFYSSNIIHPAFFENSLKRLSPSSSTAHGFLNVV